MERFHFSVRSVFVVTTLVACGLGAIVSQWRLAASAMYTVNFGLLCLSIVGAFVCRPSSRAFWVGFAAFAWCYWFVAFENTTSRRASGYGMYYSSWQNEMLSQPRLITSELIDFLESNLTTSRAVGASVTAQWRGGSFYPGTITEVGDGQYLIQWTDGSAAQWTPSAQVLPEGTHIRVTSHALLNSLVGLIGGVLSASIFCGAGRDGEKKKVPGESKSTPSA